MWFVAEHETLLRMSTPPRTNAPPSSSRERVLEVLRGRSGAMFTAEIAQLVGLHASGVRAHLYELEGAGLVSRTPVTHGRGRPRDAWTAGGGTEPGSDGALSTIPRRSVPTDADYQRLADLREGLRGYLSWAEERARDHATTPVQFQLVLAVRASAEPEGPTVGDLAEALRLKHHSVVGLLDRAENAGLVRRLRDSENGARVRVSLTTDGEDRLAALAVEHTRELARIAPSMTEVWDAFTANPPRSSDG